MVTAGGNDDRWTATAKRNTGIYGGNLYANHQELVMNTVQSGIMISEQDRKAEDAR